MFFLFILGTEHLQALQSLLDLAGDLARDGDVQGRSDGRPSGLGMRELYPGMDAVKIMVSMFWFFLFIPLFHSTR